MKNRYRLIKRGERGSTFYAFDKQLKKRTTLETSDRNAAQRIIVSVVRDTGPSKPGSF